MSKRSINLHGSTTSIFLEDAFWKELEARAEARGLTWFEYVREVLGELGDVNNRSAAVKEYLLVRLRADYEELRASQKSSQWLLRSKTFERLERCRGDCLIAGRGGRNNLVIPDEGVSRRHFMLAHDSEAWWLIDLGSKNGCYVGRKRVAAHRLRKGDAFHVGQTEVQLASD